MKVLNSITYQVLTFVAFCLSLAPQSMYSENFIFPDFDQSFMRHGKSKSLYQRLYLMKTHKRDLNELRKTKNNFKVIYNENKLHFTTDKDAPARIPKVVHQIWLGSAVPEKFHNWMNSWKMQGWVYKLWTDKEVAKFHLHNQDLYDNAKDYGEKSDILRYEILYKEGGLYIDVDFENINPALFDNLNKSYDFYAGFEPMEHRQPINSPLIGNALMASVQGHPLLHKVIYDMKAHYRTNKRQWAVICTGPVYLTDTVIQYNERPHQGYTNIFLPPTFFFPLTFSECRKNLEANLRQLKPETGAIHYWSGSWLSKDRKKKLKLA